MATFGDVLNPLIKAKTQEEADILFEELVSKYQKKYGHSRKEAEKAARYNIGYYAGYFSDDVRKRVNKFYNTSHPGFPDYDKIDKKFREQRERNIQNLKKDMG